MQEGENKARDNTSVATWRNFNIHFTSEIYQNADLQKWHTQIHDKKNPRS